MAELYWDAGLEDVEAFREIISENVKEAVRHFWEDDAPVAGVFYKDGRFSLDVLGPEKPDKEGAEEGVYFVSFDILSELKDWIGYKPTGYKSPSGDAQILEARERSALLHKLAADIEAIAGQFVKPTE